MACAAQISRLMADEDLRERIACQAGERVVQYALEGVLPMVTEQYRSVFSTL